jgi:hypothetical protein
MSDFRLAPGWVVAWHDTRVPFSNSESVDTRYRSHPVLRRILSLARKLEYGGMLIEEISESDGSLLAEENAVLSKRQSHSNTESL